VGEFLAELVTEIVIKAFFGLVGGSIRWAFFRGLLGLTKRSYFDYLEDTFSNVVITLVLIFLLCILVGAL
jgi:hypothetical protein